MKRIVALFAGCLMGYANAAATFHEPTLEQARAAYQQGDKLYRAGEPNFKAFADMIADAWIQAHKQIALEKAAKHHMPQARAEDVWPLPLANDWLGCMFYQFPDFAIYRHVKFVEYEQHPVLLHWLEKNKDSFKGDEPGQKFWDTANKLQEIAATCELIMSTYDGAADSEGTDV